MIQGTLTLVGDRQWTASRHHTTTTRVRSDRASTANTLLNVRHEQLDQVYVVGAGLLSHAAVLLCVVKSSCLAQKLQHGLPCPLDAAGLATTLFFWI